jgi:glycosyltransferase involved in cell wall biosynthesis
VLFFVFGFPPDFSGATLQTIELAKALRARGVKSSFLAETYDAALPTVSVEDGFVVRRLLRRGDRSIHRFGAALAWNVVERAADFDVLFFVGNPGEFWTTAYAAAAARLAGKRVLVELNMEFYGGDPLRIRDTRLATAKKWIGSKVERYLPNSHAILSRFPTDLVGPRVELLYYGVDLGRFTPASREEAQRLRVALGLPLDRKIVCAVGAVTRRKNPDFVLRAWKRVCERLGPRPPLLVWVGPAMTDDRECHDGAWVRSLIAQAESGPLAGLVRFVGHRDRPEDWLRASDAFAFASRQEGSPSVVREALACGLPSVVLELPGITEELIDDGRNGFLVPVADRAKFQAWQEGPYEDERARDEYAERLVRILDDRSLALLLGAKAQETAVRRFSIDSRADRVVEILNTKRESA